MCQDYHSIKIENEACIRVANLVIILLNSGEIEYAIKRKFTILTTKNVSKTVDMCQSLFPKEKQESRACLCIANANTICDDCTKLYVSTYFILIFKICLLYIVYIFLYKKETKPTITKNMSNGWQSKEIKGKCLLKYIFIWYFLFLLHHCYSSFINFLLHIYFLFWIISQTKHIALPLMYVIYCNILLFDRKLETEVIDL